MRQRRVEALFVVAIFVILVLMGFGWRSCSQRGGTYVRGALWMECVR